MDGNAGVAHEGGIGVAAACSQKWKSHQVQVCPRHTDVPACTHTYIRTCTHIHTQVRTHNMHTICSHHRDRYLGGNKPSYKETSLDG